MEIKEEAHIFFVFQDLVSVQLPVLLIIILNLMLELLFNGFVAVQALDSGKEQLELIFLTVFNIIGEI